MVHSLKMFQANKPTDGSPRHKHRTSRLAATPSASNPCGLWPTVVLEWTDRAISNQCIQNVYSSCPLKSLASQAGPTPSRYRSLWQRRRHPAAFHECHPLTTRPYRDACDLQRLVAVQVTADWQVGLPLVVDSRTSYAFNWPLWLKEIIRKQKHLQLHLMMGLFPITWLKPNNAVMFVFLEFQPKQYFTSHFLKTPYFWLFFKPESTCGTQSSHSSSNTVINYRSTLQFPMEETWHFESQIKIIYFWWHFIQFWDCVSNTWLFHFENSLCHPDQINRKITQTYAGEGGGDGWVWWDNFCRYLQAC